MGNRSSHDLSRKRSLSIELPPTWDTGSYAKPTGRPKSVTSQASHNLMNMPSYYNKQLTQQQRSSSLGELNYSAKNNPRPLTTTSYKAQPVSHRNSSVSLRDNVDNIQQTQAKNYSDAYLKGDLKKFFKAHDKSNAKALVDNSDPHDTSTQTLDRKLIALKNQRKKGSSDDDQSSNTIPRKGRKTKLAPSAPNEKSLPNQPRHIIDSAIRNGNTTTYKKKAPLPPSTKAPVNDNNNNGNNINMSTTKANTNGDQQMEILHKEKFPRISASDQNSATHPLAEVQLASGKTSNFTPPTVIIERELKSLSPVKQTTISPAANLGTPANKTSTSTKIINDVVKDDGSESDDQLFIAALKSSKAERKDMAVQYNAPVDMSTQCDDIPEQSNTDELENKLRAFIKEKSQTSTSSSDNQRKKRSKVIQIDDVMATPKESDIPILIKKTGIEASFQVSDATSVSTENSECESSDVELSNSEKEVDNPSSKEKNVISPLKDSQKPNNVTESYANTVPYENGILVNDFASNNLKTEDKQTSLPLHAEEGPTAYSWKTEGNAISFDNHIEENQTSSGTNANISPFHAITAANNHNVQVEINNIDSGNDEPTDESSSPDSMKDLHLSPDLKNISSNTDSGQDEPLSPPSNSPTPQEATHDLTGPGYSQVSASSAKAGKSKQKIGSMKRFSKSWKNFVASIGRSKGGSLKRAGNEETMESESVDENEYLKNDNWIFSNKSTPKSQANASLSWVNEAYTPPINIYSAETTAATSPTTLEPTGVPTVMVKECSSIAPLTPPTVTSLEVIEQECVTAFTVSQQTAMHTTISSPLASQHTSAESSNGIRKRSEATKDTDSKQTVVSEEVIKSPLKEPSYVLSESDEQALRITPIATQQTTITPTVNLKQNGVNASQTNVTLPAAEVMQSSDNLVEDQANNRQEEGKRHCCEEPSAIADLTTTPSQSSENPTHQSPALIEYEPNQRPGLYKIISLSITDEKDQSARDAVQANAVSPARLTEESNLATGRRSLVFMSPRRYESTQPKFRPMSNISTPKS